MLFCSCSVVPYETDDVLIAAAFLKVGAGVCSKAATSDILEHAIPFMKGYTMFNVEQCCFAPSLLFTGLLGAHVRKGEEGSLVVYADKVAHRPRRRDHRMKN